MVYNNEVVTELTETFLNLQNRLLVETLSLS